VEHRLGHGLFDRPFDRVAAQPPIDIIPCIIVLRGFIRAA
jgi:hypothetical protein